MRRAVAIPIAITFCCAFAWGQGWHVSMNKLRYRGGTVKAKVSAYDWNTTLKVTDDEIVMLINPNVTVRIKPDQVDSLSSGKEAYRRVAFVAGNGVPSSPPALFGLLHTTGKEHMIGIVYHTDDGKAAAVLLEAQKGLDAGALAALRAVTGKPVENIP